jgi:hypothetical protein
MVLLSHPFVQFDAQHQQNSQNDDPHYSKNPIKGTFQYDQKNHRKKDERGHFVPKAHVIGGIPNIIFLKLLKNHMVAPMIDDQQYNKGQFYVHPRLLQPIWGQQEQPYGKNSSQNGGGPGNDVPQALGHQFQLIGQNLLIRGGLCPCFNMVDKESGNVKEPCKPSDDKDEVQGFYIIVIFGHGLKNKKQIQTQIQAQGCLSSI